MPNFRSPLMIFASGLIAVAPTTRTAAARAATAVPTGDGSAIPMDPAHWTLGPHGRFTVEKGLETPVLEITASAGTRIVDVDRATLRGVAMRDGTVEFDARQIGGDIGGLLFRQIDDRTSDWLYIRLSADCATSGECLQYAPQRHGLMEWELFPGAQSSAPIAMTGWTHVRVVFGGQRLAVFVNRETAPSLVVRQLEGPVRTGGLTLLGPGLFTHIKVRPNDLAGLPAAKASAIEPRALRRWSVQISPLRAGDTPSGVDKPAMACGEVYAPSPTGLSISARSSVRPVGASHRSHGCGRGSIRRERKCAGCQWVG